MKQTPFKFGPLPRFRKRGRPQTQRPRKDLGTQELQAKRFMLYGPQHGTTCQSSPSLDLLYHLKAINPQQYEAGVAYYRLSQLALGGMLVRPSNRSCLSGLDRIFSTKGGKSEIEISDYGLRNVKQWRALEAWLGEQDDKLPELLHRVIVRQRLEKALFSNVTPAPHPDLKRIRKGLEWVGDYFQSLG